MCSLLQFLGGLGILTFFLLISTRAGGESWYFFMILGGINFLLHYRFLTGNFN
jgi:Trk-type K+ transport system membrane component